MKFMISYYVVNLIKQNNCCVVKYQKTFAKFNLAQSHSKTNINCDCE